MKIINEILLYNFFIITICFSVSSCDIQESRDLITYKEPTETFDVVYSGIGMDCKIPVVQFKEKDIEKIAEFAVLSCGFGRYYALDLDEEYYQTGNYIRVTIRLPRDNEKIACAAMGPFFPLIVVIDAKWMDKI
jgi:hypothetical protein